MPAAQTAERRAFELLGLEALERNLAARGAAFFRDAARGLLSIGAAELEESNRKVPVDEGDLRDSGAVQGPEQDGTMVQVRLTYGNDQVNYAVDIHEDLRAFHDDGQAKFLEATMRELKPFLAPRLAREMGAL